MNWLEPTALQGRFVRLEALAPEHAALIFEHFEPRAMTHLPSGQEIRTLEQFGQYIEAAINNSARVFWAVRLLETNQVAGFVLFAGSKPSDGWLAIGTLLMPSFWGGVANPEAKLLLMTHAFETLGVNRVQFTVDVDNQRSQAALEKLGATREATLRKYQTRAAASPSDIVIYSVLDVEWPQVKARLARRLGHC